jgi:hypothetical protein
MTNSAGPAAVGLPKNLVRLVARPMEPGSRIQVVRRLPVGTWHLNHALTCGRRPCPSSDVAPAGASRLGPRRPRLHAAQEMTIVELLRPTLVPAPLLFGADIDGERM